MGQKRLATTPEEYTKLIRKLKKKIDEVGEEANKKIKFKDKNFDDLVLADERLSSSIFTKERFVKKYSKSNRILERERSVYYRVILPRLKKQLSAIKRHKKQMVEAHKKNVRGIYRLATKKLFSNMGNLKRAYNRTKKHFEIMKIADEKINYFYNQKIQNTGKFSSRIKNKGDLSHILRAMFSKYCIDRGVKGFEVSFFVGWVSEARASTKRMEFAKEIKNNKGLLEKWHQFKKYMHQEIINIDEPSRKK